MNHKAIEITRMEMRDIDDVLLIENSSFSSPWSRDVFERELQLPISRNLVAKIHKNNFIEIAGYLTYWIIAGEVQIHKITVRGDLRQKGIASALMTEMIRCACEEEIDWCTLEVGRSNESAKKLYEKFGFTVTDVRSQYYAESREDAMIMWADLKKSLQFIHKP